VKANISEAELHRKRHIKSGTSVQRINKLEKRRERDILRIFYDKAVDLFSHIKSVAELDALADKYDKYLTQHSIFYKNMDIDQPNCV
jgi:hypothetical protein